MTEKGSFYKKTLLITASLGTLAVLATPVSAETKKQVIDCSTGAYLNTQTRIIPDGQAERISEMPDYVMLGARRGGGLIVESRHHDMGAPNTIVLGGNYDREEVNKGFYVPGKSVVSRGNSKDHEITIMGRTADNTGSVVKVKGVCVDNAPRR